MKSHFKSNAVRILEKSDVNFTTHEYNVTDGHIDAVSVAKKIGVEPYRVYKTLVLSGSDKNIYVAVIPANDFLDYKKVASHFAVKSVTLLKSSELNKFTGYIHGGCSPVGMKKLYKTVLSDKASNLDTIVVSAGKIGYQAELSPTDLQNLVNAEFADILSDTENR